MPDLSTAAVTSASAAASGSVQEAASISVLRKSLNQTAQGVTKLLEALPQPELASSGALGTQLNVYA